MDSFLLHCTVVGSNVVLTFSLQARMQCGLRTAHFTSFCGTTCICNHHGFAMKLALNSWKKYKTGIIIMAQYDMCWNVTLRHFDVIVHQFIALSALCCALMTGDERECTCQALFQVSRITCDSKILNDMNWWDLTCEIMNTHLAWWVLVNINRRSFCSAL